MAVEQLRNESSLEFKPLDSEEYREYTFPNGGSVIRIDNPLALNVSNSGGHRILDAKGISHYIPAGWIHLTWKVKSDKPHFTF